MVLDSPSLANFYYNKFIKIRLRLCTFHVLFWQLPAPLILNIRFLESYPCLYFQFLSNKLSWRNSMKHYSFGNKIQFNESWHLYLCCFPLNNHTCSSWTKFNSCPVWLSFVSSPPFYRPYHHPWSLLFWQPMGDEPMVVLQSHCSSNAFKFYCYDEIIFNLLL